MTTILVADDSAVMRRIVVRTLRQAGFDSLDVVEATDGEQLIAAVAQHRPNLVLSDWNMPGCSGIDALARLRAAGETVPFGFITSESSDEMRARAEQAGAAFLVVKPFTADAVRDAVEAYV